MGISVSAGNAPNLDVVWLILSKGGPWVILVVVIAYFLINPDKVEKWQSILAGWLSFFSKRAARLYITSDINSRINQTAKKLKREAPDVITKGVRIEWIGEGEQSAYLRDGECIVKLKRHQNQDRNIVDATALYVRTAILTGIRPHLDDNVEESLDLNLTRRVLSEGKSLSALSLFLTKIYDVQKAKRELQELCDLMEALDQRGLLTRVLLRELSRLEIKLRDIPPSSEVRSDIESLLGYLKGLAFRDPRDPTQLRFNGRCISLEVVFVASGRRYARRDTGPYLERKNKAITDGIETLYFLAWDRMTPMLRAIEKSLSEDERLVVERRQAYRCFDKHGQLRRVYLIVCRNIHGGTSLASNETDQFELGL